MQPWERTLQEHRDECLAEQARHKLVLMIQVSERRWLVAPQPGLPLTTGDRKIERDGVAGVFHASCAPLPRVVTRPLSFEDAQFVAGLLQHQQAELIPEEMLKKGVEPDEEYVWLHGHGLTGGKTIYDP